MTRDWNDTVWFRHVFGAWYQESRTQAVTIIAKISWMPKRVFVKLDTPEYMQDVAKRTNSDAHLQLSKDQNEIYTIVLDAEPEKDVNDRPSAIGSRTERSSRFFRGKEKQHSAYRRHTAFGSTS